MALTDVGAYGPNSDSYYGTNDQGGNAYEWVDLQVAGSMQSLRGGAWGDTVDTLGSDYRINYEPGTEYAGIGFRVATVPEPGTLVLTLLFSGALLGRRKR